MVNNAVKYPDLILGKSGRWYSNFTDPSGKRVRCSLKTRDVKLAQVMVRRIMSKAYEVGYFDLKRPVRKSFFELAEKVLVYAKDKTKRYKKVYLPTINKLRKYIGRKMLREITKSVVLEVQTQIKEDVSVVNSNNAMVVLRRMFNLAIDWGYIETNPVKGIELYKVPKRKVRFLTKEEIEIVIACCEGQMKDIVMVALHTGMRKSEILGLQWDNVDLSNKLIVLDKTKNNTIREIPMSSNVYALLLGKYQEKKPSRENYVFPNPDNEPYRDVAVFRKAVRLAGIECRFHDLRHTFASQLVMAGVDLVTVKELMGHSELDTTLIYAHLAPKHKKEAIAKLEEHFEKETENSFSYSPDLPPLALTSGKKLARNENHQPFQN
jgi:integrase